MTAGMPNRGRAAADENRAALIRAARQTFATDGLDAPLSLVAKRANVGQGSLYRHFPDRVSLALAVFEQNMTELEAVAKRRETRLDDVLAVLTKHVIASTAFVEMLGIAFDDPRVEEVANRVEAIVAQGLPQAKRDGRVRSDVQTAEVMMCFGMLAGVLRHYPVGARQEVAERLWALLDRAIRPQPA